MSFEEHTGSVVNGLLDGAFIRHMYWDDSESWFRSDYVLGQAKVFEESVENDGRVICYYEYLIDENGEPIFYNGDYGNKIGVHLTRQELSERRQSMNGAFCSGTEVDGGMRYYPW